MGIQSMYGETKMRLSEDKKIYLPENDKWFMWRDSYEDKHFIKSMEHISQRQLAVDIGAHVGIWTRKLSNYFDNVISFEPIPEHIECWRTNTKELNNVTIHEFALSNKTGTVKMKQAKYNSGTSSLEYKPNLLKTSTEIEIPTRTLDSFNLPKFGFMKIDVEGHELPLLEGAADTIDAYSPIIFIEIHKTSRKKNINAYDWLVSRGYKDVIEMSSSNYLFKNKVTSSH
jgi:FkbM family methyltransferase